VSYDPKVIGPKFVAWLEQDIGKDDMTQDTKLGVIGFDSYNVFSLGQQIDELSWLHGVSVTPAKIMKCKTVNDVVKLICS
jgi:acyl carrier protein